MHKDFLQKYPTIPCSYESYRLNIKELNISFTKLGHEECESCEIFEKHEHSKENLDINCLVCTSYSKHNEKAKLSRQLYREDAEKNREETDVCFSADLQKVIMLPRMEHFKIVIFTPRIIGFNESFVPVGIKQKQLKPVAAIWHEAVAGRKKEDLISSFHQFFLINRDALEITLWLDNCAAQNKNWTLMTYLIFIINSEHIKAEKIIIKFFEPGHTFMSADSFHHQVELSMKFKKNLYDFADFASAVQNANSGKTKVIEMTVQHFFDWLDLAALSQIKKKNLGHI